MPRRIAVLVLAAVLAAACEGPMGPEGPAGPQGPEGRAGTPHHFHATVDSDGVAIAELPAEAGSLNGPPGLTCYIRAPGSQIWIVVGLDTNSGIICGLGEDEEGLFAIIVAAPAGWSALFTAIY